MNWYYAHEGQRQGPVSENEFDYLVHLRKIGPDTLVWNEGMSGWRPWREIQPQPEPAGPPPLPSWAAQSREPAAPAEPGGLMWEHRWELGSLVAAAATVRELLGTWGAAFARMKLSGGWLGPSGFALLVGGTSTYAAFIFNLILSKLVPAAELKGAGAMFSTNSWMALMLAAALIFVPVLIGVIIALNTAIVHGCLMMLGEARRPLEATFRVACYSVGAASILQLVPIFGGMLAFACTLMLMTTGIARIHSVSPYKVGVCMVPIILYTGFAFLLAVVANAG